MAEFDTAMSEQDFRSLVYFTSFSKHSWVPGMLIIGMAIALTVIITFILRVWIPSQFLLIVSFGYAIIVLALMILTDRNVALCISKHKVPIGVRYHISADQNALICKIPENSKQKAYLWKDIEQIYETPEHFIIYIYGRNAFIFNKQTIGCKQSDAFHRLLKSLHTTKYNNRVKKRSLFRGIMF